MKKFIKFLAPIMAVIMMFVMTSCESSDKGNALSSSASTSEAPKTTIKVASLKGPTAMGLAKLMEQNELKTAKNNYEFTMVGAPDEIVGKISSGEIDIAAVPSNLGATLYNKTKGGVKILAVNTLGVLYLLQNGKEITKVSDLKGKTIYATGQGSSPEYILNYLLDKNGLNPKTDVTIVYKAEHSELATLMATDSVAIGMLPEPFVTSTMIKNSKLTIALDLTKEWEKVVGAENTKLAMGAIIVRTKFLEENKAAVDKFLEEYKVSTEYINKNIEPASLLVEKYGIMTAAIAKKATPTCSITYIDGSEMKQVISGFLDVLFKANPLSVGGKLPDENFYYKK